jgi:TATA-binding protein-associated factor
LSSDNYRLGDRDDDVRAVAASCLLPVAGHLVEHVPDTLDRVLAVLWGCLSDLKDDLSSSVGAVMDLLGFTTYLGKFVYVLTLIQVNLGHITKSSVFWPTRLYRRYQPLPR